MTNHAGIGSIYNEEVRPKIYKPNSYILNYITGISVQVFSNIKDTGKQINGAYFSFYYYNNIPM